VTWNPYNNASRRNPNGTKNIKLSLRAASKLLKSSRITVVFIYLLLRRRSFSEGGLSPIAIRLDLEFVMHSRFLFPSPLKRVISQSVGADSVQLGLYQKSRSAVAVV